MVVEFSLEFSPPCVYPEITKSYSWSIERENVYVIGIIISPLIYFFISGDRSRAYMGVDNFS